MDSRSSAPTRRARGFAVATLIALAAPLALAGPATPAAADPGTQAPGAQAPAGQTPGSQTGAWRVPLAPAGDDVNAGFAGGELRIQDLKQTSARDGRAFAVRISPTHALGGPANRFVADVDATVPAGAGVGVEVRGVDATGAWTEWREIGAGPEFLPSTVQEIQARVTLYASADNRSPVVRRVAVTSAHDPSIAQVAPLATPLTYRVFATREGLVGGTTANGHVITSRDHFVALPSRRGLSPKNSTAYSVKLCNPANGRCETAPVWDVGPWNTKDDYWNPSSVRQMWQTLPQGKPEAQAAYQDGFNGGKDEFGRKPSNPAGIDLADGTFWDGLGMTNNGWIDVTYLWTGDAPPVTPVWPVLQSGATGEDVKTAQYLLSARGATLSVDGDFGALTRAAVVSFQNANGLSPDGVIGALTWTKLIMNIAEGATGSAVRAAQSQLVAHGKAVPVDGVFAASTTAAVTAFQTDRAMTASGTVDTATWLALVGS